MTEPTPPVDPPRGAGGTPSSDADAPVEEHLQIAPEEDVDDAEHDDDASQGRLGDAFRWAIEGGGDATMAGADWLARDLAPGCHGAVALVTDRTTPLQTLRLAKEAFKTMRVVGERAADRRLGGQLYLAAIAAAIAHHGARISTQDDTKLRRALERSVEDHSQPPPLGALARNALRRLDGSRPGP